MKSKLIIISRDILTVILNHFLFFTAPVMFFGMFQLKNAHIPVFIALIIIPLYFLLLRYVVKNTVLLLILHLPVVFLAANISSNGLVNVMSVIISICYIILSVFAVFKLRRRQDLVFPPIMIIALIFGFSIVDILIAKYHSQSFYLFSALVYIPIYLIYSYIDNYIEFVSINESSASNIPKKRIFNSGMKQNIFFTVFTTIVLFLLSTFDFLAKFVLSLGEKLFLALRKILLSLNISGLKPVDGGTGFNDAEPPKMVGKEMDSFWFDLLGVFINVVGIIFAIALFFVIIKGFGSLFKNAKIKNTNSIVFKDELDIYEKCEIDSIKKERLKRSVFTDKRGKIRKAYKKKILKGKQKIIGGEDKLKLQYLTAKECCDKLSEPVLKELYEKAKYSNKEITSEDVKLL